MKLWSLILPACICRDCQENQNDHNACPKSRTQISLSNRLGVPDLDHSKKKNKNIVTIRFIVTDIDPL